MTNELANVPELRFTGFEDKWEETNLGNIANIVGGGTPKTEIPEYWNGEINWYSPVEIGDRNYVYESKNKITQLGLKKSSAKILPIGTVLFTARAGIGNTAILKKEGATNQGFQSIIPKEGVLDTYFIFSRTNELKRYGEIHGAGSTFVEISGKEMAKMPILIPVIKEQQKIGDFFSKLDQQIELEEQKLTLLEKQKKGYMQQIFSQELRFKDENGNEYPKWEEGTIKSLVHGNISDGNWIEKEHISKTGKYRIIQTGNIGIGKYLNKENNSKFINQKDYDELKANEIYSGDILISRLAAPAGRSMIMPDINWRMVTSVDVAIIRPNKLFDPYFLMSMLNTDKKLYDISKFVSGSSHKRISRKNLEKIKLISPEIREQQKIGDFFRKIDELIEKQNQKIDGLKERKKGFLQKMFV